MTWDVGLWFCMHRRWHCWKYLPMFQGADRLDF